MLAPITAYETTKDHGWTGSSRRKLEDRLAKIRKMTTEKAVVCPVDCKYAKQNYLT